MSDLNQTCFLSSFSSGRRVPAEMMNDRSRKKDVGGRTRTGELVAEPALYASIVETESKLRHIAQSRFEWKPVSSKV